MTIRQKREVVKELSLAISDYLTTKTDAGSHLPDNLDKQIGKIISDLLPDQPSTAELMEQIQALGGSIDEKSELQKLIQQKESELAQVVKKLEVQDAAIEGYEAKIKGLEGEIKLHEKALVDHRKAQDKAIKQLHDQHAKELRQAHERHAKELKQVHDEYAADFAKLEQARIKDAKEYAANLEKVVDKNSTAFERIGNLKETVTGIESSVAAGNSELQLIRSSIGQANNGIQSVNYMISLVRKSQRDDGLNTRQFGQMMKISDYSVAQASKKSEANNSALKTQVDRLGKGAKVINDLGKKLNKDVHGVSESAESISKSANSLSTQTTDITHATVELKKEAAVLNKLPQELKNAIASTYREEVRAINKYVAEQNEVQKKVNEQHLEDMGTIVGQVRSFIESAKKDVESDKLGSHNKLMERLSLLTDQIEPLANEFESATTKLKGVKPENFEKSLSLLKSAITKLNTFTNESEVRDSETASSVNQVVELLEGLIGGES